MAYTGEDALIAELMGLEGVMQQNPETGKGVDAGTSYLGSYTNRLFGAPFQLLDSVDRRFPRINPHVGAEYLKNFLLYSPILHIRPGMPKYTGGGDQKSIADEVFRGVASGNGSVGSTLLGAIAKRTIFKDGSRLQRRMYNFRETYIDYMMYVNHMCRSTAMLLGLDKGTLYPNGTFVGKGNEFIPFETLEWQQYRMTGEKVKKASEYFSDAVSSLTSGAASFLNPFGGDFMSLDRLGETAQDLYTVGADKITSVMMMVEPVAFTENLSNMTSPSFIESALDGIQNNIGSEIAYITNSNTDIGIMGNLVSFLGEGLDSAVGALGKIVEPATGGFLSNLFNGAIQSLKGQKMIYPDIYRNSNSSMDYEFSITLSSPYGDMYNYFMNIIVPLLHLIGLVAPRMVTANSIASPFLVQAFIPGMCTCQLGIISQMTITKNPTGKHVSVHGFPLTVKVNFTVKELYNAMAISPAHDPASFLFNETLNDYMANLAGLIPSMDTTAKIQSIMNANVGSYFTEGTWWEEFFGRGAESFADDLVTSTR